MTWPYREQLAIPNPNSGASPLPLDLSSFSEYLRRQAPQLLPVSGAGVSGAAGVQLAHGTTIVALNFPGGAVIAGDRRATQGNMIASRDVKKVYITDDYTATGIAGTAAIAVEFARLYAVELEHYEKLEGVPLTFAGKVNRLAIMVRGNLGAAMQGLVALPLLVGYDIADPNPEAAGRIVSFDAAGGWNVEDEGYQSVGSGSVFAQVGDQEAVFPSGRCGFGAAGGGGKPLRRRRRRLGHRWPRPGARHLPDRRDDQRRGRGRGARGAHRRTGPRDHRKPYADKYFASRLH